MLNNKYAKTIKHALCTTALITSILAHDAFAPTCSYAAIKTADETALTTVTEALEALKAHIDSLGSESM